MTKYRSITYTALNIRTHPHSTEKYISLMERIFDLKRPINLRGDTYAVLTQIDKLFDCSEEGMIGEIAKYTRIDSKKWFNLEKLRAAEDYETRKINIPEELRPNLTTFSFVFYPKNHYLVIECRDKYGSISPKTIEKYFRCLFDSEEIVKEFNTVELTLAPQTDQLAAIFGLKILN